MIEIGMKLLPLKKNLNNSELNLWGGIGSNLLEVKIVRWIRINVRYYARDRLAHFQKKGKRVG